MIGPLVNRSKRRIRHLRQIDQMSCGPTCLRMIAESHGRVIGIDEADAITEKSKSGVTLSSIVNAADVLGMTTKVLLCSPEDLRKSTEPWLLHWRNNHFVVCRTAGKDFIINDPAVGGEIRLDENSLAVEWCRTEGAPQLGVAARIVPDSKRFEKSGTRDKLSHLLPALKILRHNSRAIGVILALVFAGMGMSIATPILSRLMITDGLGGTGDASNLLCLLFFTQALAIAIQQGMEYLRTIWSHKIAADAGRSILADFFGDFLSSSLWVVENKNTGDFLSRVSDQNKLRTFIGSYAMSVFFDAFLVLALSCVIAFYSGPVFVGYSIGLATGVAWFAFTAGAVVRANYARLGAVSRTRNIEYEMIEGFKDLKLTNTGKNILGEWLVRQRLLNEFEGNIVQAEIRQRVGAVLLFGLTSLLVNWQMVQGISIGRFGFGDLIVVNMAVALVNQALLKIVGFFQRGEEAWQSLFRLTSSSRGISSEEWRVAGAEPIARADVALDVRNVGFRYPGVGSEWSLKDITLSVKSGQTLAIVGESGSGKTTLLKLLMHLYPPTSGEIFVDELPLDEKAVQNWRGRCGAVVQDGFLFSETLRHNISMSFGQEDDCDERALESLRIAALDDFVNTLPFGLETLMGQEGLIPSGGQTQRIFLARAIYGDPDFLFLDEATSALDASTERRIVDNLSLHCPKITKVIVAHRLSTVVAADQIVVLKDGQIIEQGNHEELLSLKSHYYGLVADQLQIAVK